MLVGNVNQNVRVEILSLIVKVTGIDKKNEK
jgi:hypothetical protein